MNKEINQITEAEKLIEGINFNSIKAITTFVYQYTLHKMSNMEILQIMFGVIVGVENVCELGIDRIKEMH